MISIKFNKKDVNVGVLKVGNVYKLEYEIEGKIITVPKALIKDINIEENKVSYEPLVDISNEENFNDLSQFASMELINKENGKLILKLK